MNQARKIRVLVVDDSAVMRQLLAAVLNADPGIEVVATAADAFIARDKIKALNPDVLTLDVEMPGMDGLTFLERLMRLRPMPVVMLSSLTERGARSTLRALELGAVDFVTKPRGNVHDGLHALAAEIRLKVRAAAGARVHAAAAAVSYAPDVLHDPIAPHGTDARVVLMGASAGGTQAIAEILTRLPTQTPGIAVVQHMPPRFTALFAANLDHRCRLDVREAQDGDRLSPGVVRVAPGGYQMALARDRHGCYLRVYPGAPVNLHRPSVDVLFESAARAAGAGALGVLLTGMGSDGARGLLAMRTAGAHTIAQDEASSVIFGMPEQAIRLGAACEVVSLSRIAERIVRWAGGQQAAVATES